MSERQNPLELNCFWIDGGTLCYHVGPPRLIGPHYQGFYGSLYESDAVTASKLFGQPARAALDRLMEIETR